MSTTLKDSFMVHPAELRVTTTAGDAIHFLPNKETFVPAYSVAACQAHGARVVKVVRGTEKKRLNLGERGAVKAIASYPKLQEVEVEEVDIDDVIQKPEKPAEQRNTQPYTPSEVKIRAAIQRVITDGVAEDFTDALVPKLGALRQYASDVKITATGRDRVWEKMRQNREITDDDLNAIFGEDDGSDADEAA